MRVMVLALFGVLLVGCPTDGGEECPDGSEPVEPSTSEACPDVFGCAPSVELAFATGPDDFAPIAEGSTQPIEYGAQGGYHFNVAAQMHNLCPVVFLTFSLDVVRDDGSRETIQELERHVQTVRCEQQPDLFADGCDGEVTQQRWWPLQLAIPCDYHPNDPDPRELDCAEPPLEYIDELHVVLRVAARDHTGDTDPALTREASAEVAVGSDCCR